MKQKRNCNVIKMLVISFIVFLFSSPISFAEKAPEFKYKDLTGEMQSLEKYKGQYLVLYFWATWCPACVHEVESIKSVYKQLKSKSVALVTVSLDRNRKQLENFVKKKKVEYPVIFTGKVWDDPIALDYRIEGTPSFVVISPQGEAISGGSWSDEIFAILNKHL